LKQDSALRADRIDGGRQRKVYGDDERTREVHGSEDDWE